MTDIWKKIGGFLKRSYVTRTEGYTNVFPKRELWEKVANEIGGSFKISHNSGCELEILRIYMEYKGVKIVISESDTRPLKFEMEFLSAKNFELSIGWEDSIDRIIKTLGKREVEIGNLEFDNHYLINTNDGKITKSFLTREITNLLLKHNVCSLSYLTDKKKGISNFASVINRTTSEKENIVELVELHQKIIDSLVVLELISSDD